MKNFKIFTLFLVGSVAFANAGLLGLGNQKSNKGNTVQLGQSGGGLLGGATGKGAENVGQVNVSAGLESGSGSKENSGLLGGLLGGDGILGGAVGKGSENVGQGNGPAGAESGLGGTEHSGLLGDLLGGGGILGGASGKGTVGDSTGLGGVLSGLGNTVDSTLDKVGNVAQDAVSSVGGIADNAGLNVVGAPVEQLGGTLNGAVDGVGKGVGGILGADRINQIAGPNNGNSYGVAPVNENAGPNTGNSDSFAPVNDNSPEPIVDSSNGPSNSNIFDPYVSLDTCVWVRHVFKRLILGTFGFVSGATTTLLDNEGIGNIYQAAYISTPTNLNWKNQHFVDSAVGTFYGISGNLESNLHVRGINAKVDALIDLLLPQCGQSGTRPTAPSATPKAIQQLIIEIFKILMAGSRQPNGFETSSILKLIFNGSNGPDGNKDGSNLITLLFGGQTTPQNWGIPNAARWPITWFQNGQNGTCRKETVDNDIPTEKDKTRIFFFYKNKSFVLSGKKSKLSICFNSSCKSVNLDE